MDSKTLRLAVLLSITAVALILLVVYAANAGSRRRANQEDAQSAGEQAGAAGSGDAIAETMGGDAYLTTVGDSFRAYGEQIGSQPKAFLYDESFFDPMHDVGRGISEGDEEPLTLQAVARDDTIHVSILNARGGLESGVAFQVSAEQVQTGKEKTWTDTDRDGQIDLTNQASGNYRLRLLEVQGYEVPTAAVVVKVEAPVRSTAATSATAEMTNVAGGGMTEEGMGDGSTPPGTGATGDASAGISGAAGMAGSATTGDTGFGADRW